MRNVSLRVTLGLAILISCSIAASTQNNPQARAKVARSSQFPDLSGVWMRDAPPASNEHIQYWVYEFNVEEPPMTAWGDAQYKAAKSSFGDHPFPLGETNDPVYHIVFRQVCHGFFFIRGQCKSFRRPAKLLCCSSMIPSTARFIRMAVPTIPVWVPCGWGLNRSLGKRHSGC